VYSGKLEAGSRTPQRQHRAHRAGRRILICRHHREESLRVGWQIAAAWGSSRSAPGPPQPPVRSDAPDQLEISSSPIRSIKVAIRAKTGRPEKISSAVPSWPRRKPDFQVQSTEETARNRDLRPGDLPTRVLVDPACLREFKVTPTSVRPQVFPTARPSAGEALQVGAVRPRQTAARAFGVSPST